jgi:hypothetical protein
VNFVVCNFNNYYQKENEVIDGMRIEKRRRMYFYDSRAGFYLGINVEDRN